MRRSTVGIYGFASAILVAAVLIRIFGFSSHEGVAGIIDSSWSFDYTDKRQLVGFASNVFVGRVTAKKGNQPAATADPNVVLPQTQFTVEVMDIVKGDLKGTITVNQMGGYVEKYGGIILVDEDPLLEVGQEYLFITRYISGHD